MSAEIIRLADHRQASDNPIYCAIAELAERETPNQAWLRRAGPIARRLNLESKFDPSDGDAA